MGRIGAEKRAQPTDKVTIEKGAPRMECAFGSGLTTVILNTVTKLSLCYDSGSDAGRAGSRGAAIDYGVITQ